MYEQEIKEQFDALREVARLNAENKALKKRNIQLEQLLNRIKKLVNR